MVQLKLLELIPEKFRFTILGNSLRPKYYLTKKADKKNSKLKTRIKQSKSNPVLKEIEV